MAVVLCPSNQVKTSQQVQKLEGMVLRKTERAAEHKSWNHASHESFRVQNGLCSRRAGGLRHLGVRWDGVIRSLKESLTKVSAKATLNESLSNCNLTEFDGQHPLCHSLCG